MGERQAKYSDSTPRRETVRKDAADSQGKEAGWERGGHCPLRLAQSGSTGPAVLFQDSYLHGHASCNRTLDSANRAPEVFVLGSVGLSLLVK